MVKKFRDNCKRLDLIDNEYNKYFGQIIGPGAYNTEEPRIDYDTFYTNPEVRLDKTGIKPFEDIGHLTNVDSELQGLNYPTSRDCPGHLHIPTLKKPRKQNFVPHREDNSFLIQQPTRVMNPACLDRGRGINRFEFTPYNEQRHAFNIVPFQRLCWTRLDARDKKENLNEDLLYKCNPYCKSLDNVPCPFK